MLMLHSAQKQGKRGEGFTCSNSHTNGQTLICRGCERWRLVLGAARAPHMCLFPLAPCPCLFLLQLLELPLPLQLLAVPLLSSQPFSWGLRLQEQGQGVHTGALGAHFENHPQNHYELLIHHFKFSSERAPRTTKIFRFLPNNYLISKVIVNIRYSVFFPCVPCVSASHSPAFPVPLPPIRHCSIVI